MRINSTNNNYKNKQTFNANCKIIDPHKLISPELVAQYTEKYASKGASNDKIAIKLEHDIGGDFEPQIKASVAVLKDNELIPFTDKINVWIYSSKEAAETQLGNLYEKISRILEK